MKTLLIILISISLISCSKSKDKIEVVSALVKSNPILNNELLFLKVGFMAHEFEGGTELIIKNGLASSDSIPIRVLYDPPMDAGNITLFYNSTNDTLFDGTIQWMGLGKMNYPRSLNQANTYSKLTTIIEQPNSSRFQHIPKNEYDTENDNDKIEHIKVWNAINKLEIVSNYLKWGKKIGMFLYAPSVGSGDPYEWDWIVIMSK